MARILVLADSGFGKTTSIGPIKELNIKGLDYKETFIISCSQKSLSIPGWKNYYKPVSKDATTGNLFFSNDAKVISKLIDFITASRSDIKNIVVDDVNYVMQDYYMEHAKSKNYEVFKNIGHDFNALFVSLDNAHKNDKNVIVTGHYEIDDTGGIIQVRLKTVGKMVNNYMTPEGKFEVVLIGVESYDEKTKTVSKTYLTSYDGIFRGKAPYGMFTESNIPNDLGYVLDKALEFESKN